MFRTRHWSTVPRSGEASGRRPATSTAVGPLFTSQTLATRGAGALILGDKAAFDVFAPADGYYTVHADYASAASSTLSLDGDTAVTLASISGSLTDKTLKLYLSAGNNRITAAGPSSGSLTLRDLRVTSGIDTTGATTCQAEAATRAGAAAVANNTWASGGKYAGSIGNGSGDTLTFQVHAPAAGRCVMNVRRTHAAPGNVRYPRARRPSGCSPCTSCSRRPECRYANNQVSGSGNYNLEQLLRLRTRHRQGDRRAA